MSLRCDDGGKKLLSAIGLSQVSEQSMKGFNWVIDCCDNIYVLL